VAAHVLVTLAVPLLQVRAWHRHSCRERAGAEMLAELGRSPWFPAVAAWSAVPTVGDTVVLRATTVAEGDVMVKVALSEAASGGLDRHAGMLRHLADVDGARSCVPELVARGSIGHHHCVVERAVAGSPLTVAPDEGSTTTALQLMAAVHVATAHEQPHGIGSLHEAVGTYLARVARVCRTDTRRRTVAGLTEVLAVGLGAQRLVTSVVHGDFWPGNVLAVGDPGRRLATSIVDWERASPSGLPELDLVHYLLDVHPGGFADGVRASLTSPDGTVGEWLAAAGVCAPNPQLGRKLCTVLAWLGHVGAGLETTRRFGAGPLWVRNEVSSVLDVLGADAGLLAELADGRG
jgi:aminoglycoside phosphotransferase (APT) family kinase protein